MSQECQSNLTNCGVECLSVSLASSDRSRPGLSIIATAEHQSPPNEGNRSYEQRSTASPSASRILVERHKLTHHLFREEQLE